MKKGIVVAVIGGTIVAVVDAAILPVILNWPSLVAKTASWAWTGVSWAAGMLVSSHPMPGWTIVGMGLLALLGLIVLGNMLKRNPQTTSAPPFLKYTEDIIDGAKWRWRWSGNKIANLCCFCPSCDAQLVYADSFDSTHFICERCPSDGTFSPYGGRGRTVATVMGGGRQYAVGATEREILRRIRTGER